MEKTYLGDGVYAWCEPGYIWLETERNKGPERIAIEHEVWLALKEFAKNQWGHKA